MALSRLATSGSQKTCEVCETDTNIKGKCLDCNLLLCAKCKKTHLKFKNTEFHEVVSSTDIGSCGENESKRIKFKPVMCTIHTIDIGVIYCKTCCILACPPCIVEKHQGHEFVEIKTICEEKVEQLKQKENQLNLAAKEYAQNLNIHRKTEEAKFKDMQSQIKEEEKRAIDEVRRIYADKLDILQERQMKVVNEPITQKKENIDKKRRDIEQQRQDLQRIFDARETGKFLKSSDNFHEKLDQFSQLTNSNHYKMKTLQYSPGKFFLTKKSDISDIEIELAKVRSFKTNFTFIRGLTVDSCMLWIADDKNIEQVDTANEVKVIQKHTVPFGKIMAMKCTKKDEILITAGSEIKRLESNGAFETIHDFKPAIPATMHISNDNEIVVGMDLRQTKDTKNVAAICILNPNGTTKNAYWNIEKKLVSNDLVLSCTTVADGGICFIDSKWSVPGGERVVMVDKNRSIQWIYKGTPEINAESCPFTPVDVEFAKNIIISDNSSGILHILSADGHLLTALNLEFIGIKRPGLLLIDSNGYLWINDTETMHKLKYSGF